MKRTLLVFEETLNLSSPPMQALVCVLGPGKAFRFSDVENLERYDRVVICAGPEAREKVLDFVVTHLALLETRPTALINLSDKPDEPAWVPEVSALIGCQVKQGATLGLADPLEVFIDFALSFRSGDQQPSGEIPQGDLREVVENFLEEHNTCVLATSYRGRARATPLEYRYADGCLYCVSEGGEKFAGILRTGYVALAICEPYRGFEHLAGMQLMGRPFVPVFGSEPYQKVIHKFGLSMDKISQLPIQLHAFEIRLDMAVFLWSGFSEDGKDMRQVFRFDHSF